MFLKHAQIAPARVSDLLSAAEKAESGPVCGLT
mgnify:CR=1 FL=1